LGISHALRLEINSLGTSEDRAAYHEKLVAYFTEHKELLDEDSQRRLGMNPLRILDSKNPAMQEMIEAAPKLRDHLGEEANGHFEQLQTELTAAGAQGTVCAGGRYDGLVTQLGGPETPAVGWGMGIERLLVLVEELLGAAEAVPAHAYLVAMGAEAQAAALGLAEKLRDEVPGLRLTCNVSGGNAKAQFKKADRSGAALALVIGEQELADGSFTVKPLRGDGEQETLDVAATIQYLIALTEKD